MATEFRTEGYEAAHGKKPCGVGCWAFGTISNPDVLDMTRIFFSPSVSYAAAKKLAAAHFKNPRVLFVLS